MVKLQARTTYGNVVDLEVGGEDTVDTLKAKLHPLVQIPQNVQKILYNGKLLVNGKIGDSGIKDGDSIIILQRRPQPSPPSPDPTPEPDAAAIRKAIARARKEGTLKEDEEEDRDEEEPELGNRLQDLVNSLFGFSFAPPPSSARGGGGGGAAPVSSTPSPEAIAQLTDMGFSEARARQALVLNRMNVPQAMEWLLEHSEDDDADNPPPSETGAPVGPTAEQRLLEMGFPSEDVTRALQATGNNYEAACAWLLGDNEESDDSAIDEDSPLVRAIFSHPAISAGLTNPRVLQAFRAMVENPSTVTNYLTDPEIGPLIIQVHAILQGILPSFRGSS